MHDARFYRLPGCGRDPIPASRDALGTLPMRAVRYCEAATMACGCGRICSLIPTCRSGGTSRRSSTSSMTWRMGSQYRMASVSAALTAIPEPSIIQMSLGIAAYGGPGWGLLRRRPAHYPVPGAIEHFEGTIDPAGWFGPMFINLRITRTDTPMRRNSDRPLAQVQPASIALLQTNTADVADMGDDEWADWSRTVTDPLGDPIRDFGGYAA